MSAGKNSRPVSTRWLAAGSEALDRDLVGSGGQALGGQIEVRAIFPDEVITLLGDGKVTETVRPKRSASVASAR